MLKSRIDHLVVTAPTLDSGAASIARVLGVQLERGGKHDRMGTHNLLLRLGDTIYLEVIAIDPNGQVPLHPRWFGLDQMGSSDEPQFAAWVARTENIRAVPKHWGNILPMQRGPFDWLITVPEDGHVLFDGLVPMLIQWKADQHPAAFLPDRGCSLEWLEGFHSQPDRIREWLQMADVADEIVVSMSRPGESPRLVAHIRTPSGVRRLDLPGAHRG